MKQLFLSLALLALAVVSMPAQAQVPHIVGTWKLNLEASEITGSEPQSQIRQYSLAEDGFLVGLAVTIDASGNPGFLQIAAKSDGKDYPEYSSGDLAMLQMNNTATPLAYAERIIDEYTVEWFDKYQGEVYATGTRQVSEDGQTMTLIVNAGNEEDAANMLKFVFDRQ